MSKKSPLTTTQQKINCEPHLGSQLPLEEWEKLVSVILVDYCYVSSVVKKFNHPCGLEFIIPSESLFTDNCSFLRCLLLGLEVFEEAKMTEAAKYNIESVVIAIASTVFFQDAVKKLKNKIHQVTHSNSAKVCTITLFDQTMKVSLEEKEELLRLIVSIIKASLTQLLSTTIKDIKKGTVSSTPSSIQREIQIEIYNNGNPENLQWSQETNLTKAVAEELTKDVLFDDTLLENQIVSKLLKILQLVLKKRKKTDDPESSELYLFGTVFSALFQIDIGVFKINTQDESLILTKIWESNCQIVSSRIEAYKKSQQKLVLVYEPTKKVYGIILPKESVVGTFLKDTLAKLYPGIYGNSLWLKQIGYLDELSVQIPPNARRCQVEKKIHWYSLSELHNSCSVEWLTRFLFDNSVLAKHNQTPEGLNHGNWCLVEAKSITSVQKYRKDNLFLQNIIQNPNNIQALGIYLSTLTEFAYIGTFKLVGELQLSPHLRAFNPTVPLYEYSLENIKSMRDESVVSLSSTVCHVGPHFLSHQCLTKTQASYPIRPPLAQEDLQPHQLARFKDDTTNQVNESLYTTLHQTKLLYHRNSKGEYKLLSLQYPNSLEDMHFTLSLVGEKEWSKGKLVLLMVSKLKEAITITSNQQEPSNFPKTDWMLSIRQLLPFLPQILK